MKKLALPILVALLAAVPLAAQSVENWEGLTKVRSKNADGLWLLPDVDFRSYTKVKLDPTEVAFRRNWQRNYNSSSGRGRRRIDDRQAARIAEAARTGFEEIFANAYREAGYQVVTEDAPDVLRLRTAVLNLFIAAPDPMDAGASRSYSTEAGEATLVLEARDSLTGALLGRAVDQRIAGDTGGLRNSVTNRADFEDLFRDWARISVRGLGELKARSPVNAAAAQRR